MSQPLLTLKKLACARGGRLLFEGLDLSLHAGNCVEVRGPNGSGKSTLLRVVAGLFPDYDGQVEAAERFYLGHKPAVNALLTPRENLAWHERAASRRDSGGSSGRGARIEQALQAVGLQAWSETPCGELSQGQQRRAALARALVCAAPLWLLDEPLTALDAQGRTLVGRFAEQHCAAGGAVLCATHESLGCASFSVLDLGRRT